MASQTVTKPLVVLAARTGRLHVLKLLMDQVALSGFNSHNLCAIAVTKAKQRSTPTPKPYVDPQLPSIIA